MDYRHLCVFDLETSSLSQETTQIIQIGSCIINRNNLSIVDEFQTLVKPKDMDAIEDEALKVNGLTKEQLEDAPDVDVIFPVWANWINEWNTSKNSWGAPIPAGWGSDRFDVPILERYCRTYDYWDDKWNNMTLMNPIFTFDVMKHFWFWTRSNTDVKNCKLATAVAYMGGATDEEIEANAHDALWDVRMTAKIAQKFLRVSRWANEYNKGTGDRRMPMKNCFKKE